MSAQTWPQLCALLQADRQARNATGGIEEYNSIEEAIEAFEYDKAWELINV